MGGSSKSQVTGYRYFANFLLFIGNPIEKVLGINFDKRGWQTPLIDEKKNPLSIGEVKLPNLYGENEGGVAGKIHARYGTENPQPVDFYSSYLAKNDLPPLAYPYQSYLAFTGLGTPDFGGGWVGNIIGAAHGYYNNAFYLGNSGYMKEMLLWVKRTRIRNDGSEQWYATTVERPWVCEIGTKSISSGDIEGKDFNFSFKVKNTNSFTRPGMEHEEITEREVKVVYQYDPNSDSLIPNHYRTTDHYSRSPSYGHGPYYYYEREISIHPDTMGLIELIIDVEMKSTDKPEIEVTQGNIVSIDDQTIETTDERGSISRNGIYRVVVLATGGESIVIRLTLSRALDGFKGHILDSYFRLVKKPFSKVYLDENQDINPIHKIREILTDDTAMGKPESDVNDANFIKAADRIYDEGLGISWSITEKSCLEAIEELCGHIEAGVRVNRQTGLYEVVLFRDDWFEESEIHAIAVNKIKSMSLEIANADEAINQLNVSYYNRDAIKDSSFSIAENASIRNLNGRVNAEDADFSYFMNQRNVAVVAQWKLKQMSTPVWKGSFTTAEYNARKWNRYDLLKLAWPRKWQGEITVRIMKINLGTGADVSIDFIEVVPYSSQLCSDVVIDEPIDVGVQPPLACQYEPFEMPYYLAVMALGQRQVDEELSYENNFGLVGVVAEQPQSNSLYAVMMTHDGTEGEEWVRAATINYEPAANLDQIISRTSTSFVVKDSAAILGLPIGTLIKCGSDWIGTPGEWMVFQSIDPYTGVVSVKRGALDSLPQAWGVGTKLYFCGNDVAYDSTEYVAGEEVLVSALTTTPSGMLEQEGSIAIEMNARAIRPYPPGNFKINNQYFPLGITGPISLSWASRNRLQQTGGEPLGFQDGSVTPEEGTTYSVYAYNHTTGELKYIATEITTLTHVIGVTALLGISTVRLEVFSVRDGHSSYQAQRHVMEWSSGENLMTFDDSYTPDNGNAVVLQFIE